MKRILSFFTAFVCLAVIARAQDCEAEFELFKTGVTLEYTLYDKKDKVTTIMTQKVNSVTSSEDTVIANVESSAVDEKGKSLYQSKFPIKCHKRVLYFDMRSMVPGPPAQSADMTMEISGNDLMFLADMKPGQTLPDSDMEMKVSVNGIKVMNPKYRMYNRKVEAEENITTTAGTYKCFKISYDMEYKYMGTRTSHTDYWYSEKVGTVKSVSYDKKGNVESTMLLTKFTK